MYMYYDLRLNCLYLSNLKCDTSAEHTLIHCVSVSKHGVLLNEDDTQAQ